MSDYQVEVYQCENWMFNDGDIILVVQFLCNFIFKFVY